MVFSIVGARAFISNPSCLRSLSRLWLLFYTPLALPLFRFRR